MTQKLDILPRLTYLIRMKRCNSKLLKQWVDENGEHEAIAKILKKTGLKPVTVDKMIRGKYPSEPNYLLRKALVELTHIDESELFPEVAAKGKAS